MKKKTEDGTIALIETFVSGQNLLNRNAGEIYTFNDKTGELVKFETGLVLRCMLGALSDNLGSKLFLYKKKKEKNGLIYCSGETILVSVENEEDIENELMLSENLVGPFETATELLEKFHEEEDKATLERLKEHFIKANGSLENWALCHDERVVRKGKYYITET